MSRVSTAPFCLLLILLAIGANAQPDRYVLRVHGKKYETNVVQLYDQRTKRTVWTRTCVLASAILDKRDFFWSSDHHAVAFAILPKNFRFHGQYEGFQLVIWRAGGPARIFAHQRLTADEGVEEMVWSPSGRWVLVRAGGSGGAMLDTGRVYCASATSSKLFYVDFTIGKPAWIGPRTVRYWKPRQIKSYLPSGERYGWQVVRARRASRWHLPNN